MSASRLRPTRETWNASRNSSASWPNSGNPSIPRTRQRAIRPRTDGSWATSATTWSSSSRRLGWKRETKPTRKSCWTASPCSSWTWSAPITDAPCAPSSTYSMSSPTFFRRPEPQGRFHRIRLPDRCPPGPFLVVCGESLVDACGDRREAHPRRARHRRLLPVQHLMPRSPATIGLLQ